ERHAFASGEAVIAQERLGAERTRWRRAHTLGKPQRGRLDFAARARLQRAQPSNGFSFRDAVVAANGRQGVGQYNHRPILGDLSLSRQPELLWQPSERAIEEAQLTQFARQVSRKRKLDVASYPEFYQWS